jgi:hypothetical protein
VFLLILNVGFSIGIFGSFIASQYTENVTEISSSIILMQRVYYQLELGLKFSIIPITIYVLILLALFISAICVSINSEKWSVSHLDRLSIFSSILILFLFSPNFFQLLILMVIIDIIVLEFLYFSLKSSKSTNLKGFKQMLMSVIMGNVILISSIAMLIRKVRSFDYHSIFIDIQYKFFLFTPYFILICILFLLGLTAKSSIFPFHVWKRKTLSEDESSFFFVQLHYILLPVLIVFITPYIEILHVIQNVFTWYGILISFLAILGAIFIKERTEFLSFLLTSSFGFLLFFFGTGYNLIAFHQLLLIPFVFISLAILILRKKKKIQNIKRKTFVQIIVWIISIILPLLIILGIPPISSKITGLTYSFINPNLIANYGLLVFGICILLLAFIVILKVVKEFWIERKQIYFAISDTISFSFSSIILILLSLLFPYFLIFEPFPPIPLTDLRLYLYTALPLGVVCLLILISYLTIPRYLKQVSDTVQEITTSASPAIEKVANFDFIYELFSLIYLNIIVPSSRWVKEKIIVSFFAGIILTNLNRFFKFIFLKLKYFIFDILIPFLKKHFARISKFIRGLERTTNKLQIQLTMAFLLILIVIVVVLYFGGGLQ